MAQKKDFEKFYSENIDKIYRFVFFRIGERDLTEDLVSEIFMKALRNFEGYDEKISRSAWLFTIAKNHLANFWRDKKGESLPEINEEGIEPTVWLEKATAIHENSLIKAEIYDFLANLEVEEREIVTFHYLYGYSYLEIAEMKNLNEGAIKTAAHRAIKKIREKI